MLEFSMGNTLVMFSEKYYEYGVDNDLTNRSGYDSAWNADLIASYLLDLAQDHLPRQDSSVSIVMMEKSSSAEISRSKKFSLVSTIIRPK